MKLTRPNRAARKVNGKFVIYNECVANINNK